MEFLDKVCRICDPKTGGSGIDIIKRDSIHGKLLKTVCLDMHPTSGSIGFLVVIKLKEASHFYSLSMREISSFKTSRRTVLSKVAKSVCWAKP